MMDMAGKNILIVGLGASGLAAARFLKEREARVTVTDIAAEKDIAGQASEARRLGVRTELGRHDGDTFESADLIVISPGVPHTIPPVRKARDKGVPVWGEIELASRFIREPMIAITGTNGKTTATTLIGKMLEKSGVKTFVGGNIGNPLIGYAAGKEIAEMVVVEVSSFQLDTIETFRPNVAVLLNITDDHMDRYPDFEAYAFSKGRIFENQQAGDIAVINALDPAVCAVGENIRSRKIPFYHDDGHREPARECAVIGRDDAGREPVIRLFSNRHSPRPIELSGIRLTGGHNLENAAAAALAALAAGARADAIRETLREFDGLSHRLEYVAALDDVRFFDDSKATNTGAVVRALEAFETPVVLIMGGRDKGGNFSLLRDAVRRRVKRLILLGEARSIIEAALGDACDGGTEIAADMQDAVVRAFRSAAPGDAVLLSPGCASFDMYTSYARRGEDFCRAVGRLAETLKSEGPGAVETTRPDTKDEMHVR